MIEFLTEHSEVAGVLTSIGTMVIWVMYLNLFYISLRRNRKPMILLSRGAGTGPEARLFISNMGAEPIYISALIADCECGKAKSSAFITENDHISAEEMTGPAEATNEGPLGSGDYLDAGSFESLMTRIEKHAESPIKAEKVDRLTLTVIASTGYAARTAAASASFAVLKKDGTVIFHPEEVHTRQRNGIFARRRIRRRLNKQLADEIKSA